MTPTLRMACLALAAALFSGPVPVAAQVQCSPVANGKQRCTAGLPAPALPAISQTQRGTQWCWAAVLSMVLRSHGLEVPQEEIVRRSLGEMADKPVSVAALAGLLNASWPDTSGRQGDVQGDVLPPWRAGWGLAAPEVLGELQEGRPMILVRDGHAVVLVQLVYEVSTSGGAIDLLRAVVLDPGLPVPLRSARREEWQPQAAFRVEVRTRNGAS